MNNIKVSMIMPVYNSQTYLKDTLDSILNQSLEEFELIAIDDGSTDNSLKILKEYENKYNKIKVVHQINSGVSETRNRGIELAKGEYIGFVDADDLLEKDFIKILYNSAKEYNADISMTGYSTFYDNPNMQSKVFTAYKFDNNDKKRIFEEMLSIGLGVNIWTKLYKKAILHKYNIKFEKNMSYDEDMFFSWKCALASNNIVFDNNTRYFYRLSINSATMKYHPNLYEKYCIEFQNIKKFAKDNNLFYEELNNQININFAKKLNVIITMIIRSKTSIKQKYSDVKTVLQDECIKKGLLFLDNSKFYKNLKLNKIFSVMSEVYLIDKKVKLARIIKKYLRF